MKLCKDCKYFIPKNKSFWSNFGNPFYILEKNKCSHPVCLEPIHGNAKEAKLCRIFECGSEARLFEEK